MNPMRIFLNGTPHEVPGGITLEQALGLLRELPAAPTFATAVNGQHVLRAQRATTLLANDDQITTFEPITGG